MEFIVDKVSSTVQVKRVFKAAQSDVWAAWTEPQILDQWWAPKPYLSKTKSMDFKEGGRRLYAMVGPHGEEHWSLADYISITPITHFEALDGFCDEDGNLNPGMPRSNWNVEFSESNGKTTVEILIKHGTPEALEMHIKMGFKEGFSATMEELANLLEAKSN